MNEVTDFCTQESAEYKEREKMSLKKNEKGKKVVVITSGRHAN